MKSINPEVWGPSVWKLIHRMSFAIKSLKDFAIFIKSLETILPCNKCRINLSKHLAHLNMPQQVSHIPEWTYQLHQRVNKDLDKHTNITFNDVKGGLSKNFDKLEWIFICCIIDIHPGARYVHAHPKYLDGLTNFMNIVFKYTPELSSSGIVSYKYKTALKIWLRKNKSTIKFNECHA
jgi:hypothetical protein